jgi:hypothetical protein
MLGARPVRAWMAPEARLAWQVAREAAALRAAAWMVLPASRALRTVAASVGLPLRRVANLRAMPARRMKSHPQDRESRA